MTTDFTIDKYKELCTSIIDSKYQIITVEKFIAQQPEGKVIILRHDVDRRPKTAYKMASIESSLNLNSTYYFRYMPLVYNPTIINQINSMGHEIGYHYETLSKAHGNHKKAWSIFRTELEKFRQIYDVKTISMHGRPFLPWNNIDIWKYFDYSEIGITGEAYLSLDFSKIAYFSDTGRNWNSSRYNIRDKVHGLQLPEIEKTDELIKIIQLGKIQQLCIVTHPNRWSHGRAEHLLGTTADFIINQLKRSILFFKKYK